MSFIKNYDWKGVWRRRSALSLGASVLLAPGAFAQELDFSAYVWLEPGRGDGIWAIVEACAAEQDGVTVKQAAVPFSSYENVILQQLAAGAGPDLMQLRINQFAVAAQAGLLAGLDQYVNEDEIVGLTEANNYGIVDGTRYGYIQEVTNFGLFYNVTMLEEAGVEPPETFEELLDAAKALTNAEEGQYGLAFRHTVDQMSGWQSDFTYFMYGFGASLVDEKGYPSIDTPEMLTAAEAYLEVYNSGVMPIGTDSATFRRMFAEGKVAMLLQNQNVPVTIQEMNGEMVGNIEAVVPPFPTGKQPMISALFAINNSSNHKEQAGKILQCVLRSENQQQLAVALGGGSPAVDVYSEPSAGLQGLLDGSPWLGAVEANAGPNAISIIPVNAAHVYAKYANVFFQELARVQAGEADLAESLAIGQSGAMEIANDDEIISSR